MTRALVTGGNGFVGRYLAAELRARGVAVVVAGRPDAGAPVDLALDLADAANVRGVVDAARADVVFHLAAQASVADATRDPLATCETNVMGTMRLIDALRTGAASAMPRLMFASSGEVYGARERSALPSREDARVQPATMYAASKVAGEALVLAAARTYGVPAIVTRAFNHVGPGQSERFVVAAFARRLAAIAAGGPPLFAVGNLEPARDFLDVRDVVRAYADLATHGADGEIYNVCSGVATTIKDVLRHLVTAARVGVEIREDASLVRSADVPLAYGDNAKLVAATGWAPAVPLVRSLRETYAAARAEAVAAR